MQEISGIVLSVGWISGKGVSTWAKWGAWRKRCRPGRRRRSSRRKSWTDHTTTPFCKVILFSKAVGKPTGRRGCLLLGDLCTKTGRPVIEVLRENQLNLHVLPVEELMCAYFEEYEKIPETVTLDFSQDDVTWVASKISGAVGALGTESIGVINCLISFRCTLEELRIDHYTIMAFWLVTIEKCLGVHPVGIRETLRRPWPKSL